MCAGGGRKEGRCNRYTRATVQTVRDRRFCENVNGDGSCCTICEEPATAPSPPVLRVLCVCGLSPWRSVVTEGHRAWARRFFNPYEFYITMFNEEKETVKFEYFEARSTVTGGE